MAHQRRVFLGHVGDGVDQPIELMLFGKQVECAIGSELPVERPEESVWVGVDQPDIFRSEGLPVIAHCRADTGR